MGEVRLAVETRDTRGKGAARKLRAQGLVPGVVYGGGREATAVSVDSADFERMLEKSHSGINTLIDLEGGSSASGRTVIAKDVQREAVRGALRHVDFYEVDLKATMEVSVPIHLEGTPEGVVNGGVLDQHLREITLLCLPDSIPDELIADVSDMELGEALHVSDLTVPAGVELATDDSLTVATILVPRGLKEGEGEVAPVAEGAEGAEGAEDAVEGDDEKAADGESKSD